MDTNLRRAAVGDPLYEDKCNQTRSHHPSRGSQKFISKPSSLRYQRLINPVSDQTREKIMCPACDHGQPAFHAIALVLVMMLEGYHQRELAV